LDSPEGAKKVIDDMQALKQIILHPNNLRVQLVGPTSEVKDVKQTLSQIIPSNLPKFNMSELSRVQLSQELTANVAATGNVLGIAAIDNSFLYQSGRGLVSFSDVDEAPLLVLIEYLTGMESPFWKKIRGMGLSYGYGISMKIEEGLIYFTLTKSSHVAKAFEVSKAIVSDLVAKQTEIEDVRLESAKSGAIFGIVSREETMESATLQSLLNYFRNVAPNNNSRLMSNIQQVTKDDLLRVLQKYLHPLFDVSGTNLAIATNTSKVEDVIKGFSDLGRNVQTVNYN